MMPLSDIIESSIALLFLSAGFQIECEFCQILLL